MVKKLRKLILEKKAKVGIIGLGYVGLPLAVEFANAGFTVYGIDTAQERVNQIKKGSSYIIDVPSSHIKRLVSKGKLHATCKYDVIKKLDAIIICVPTPLSKTREPDISYIIEAVKRIAEGKKKGQLIVLESTTYPGTTDEIVLPILESKGLKAGRDFFLAFSPERIDPANKQFGTSQIPKVIGGFSKTSGKSAEDLYGQIMENVVLVSSSKIAEMTKLLENTFRSVNIGLVNELTLMCDKLGVDVWEVIEAAKTKPFGFMPFYPGPGIGGHCIKIDPLYLSWKARLHGFEAKFIELADQINSGMPEYVVGKITSTLNKRGKTVKESKILILGTAYKRDVSDTRESPAIEIIRILKNQGAMVSYSDPYVFQIELDKKSLKSSNLNNRFLKSRDCVVIVTDHSNVDYRKVVKNSKLVVDTRNATRHISNNEKRKVVKL